MGRMHLWQDKMVVKRMTRKVTRGAVEEASEETVGDEVQCLLTSLSGTEVPEDARTYQPEQSVLHYRKIDAEGAPVRVLQGDTLEVYYNLNGTQTLRGRYKIVADIRPNRRGRELVSFSVEVRREDEH